MSTELKEFFTDVKARLPQGTGRNGFLLRVAGTVFQVIIFNERGGFKAEVQYGLFLPNTKYSRKTLTVLEDGTLSEDTEGIIPDTDITDHEPDFSSVTNEEIAHLVVTEIKRLGYPQNTQSA